MRKLFVIACRVTQLWSREFRNARKKTVFVHITPCFCGVSKRIQKSFRIALELVKEHFSRKAEAAGALHMEDFWREVW